MMLVVEVLTALHIVQFLRPLNKVQVGEKNKLRFSKYGHTLAPLF